MKSKLLLNKLENLVKIDNALSFESKNPHLYRQRAILLQELGCNALAMYDNRICAFLEQKTSQDFYNHSYVINDMTNLFEKIFELEINTTYFQYFFSIVRNDKNFLENEIDPAHFMERGNTLAKLNLINLAFRDFNDATRFLKPYPIEYSANSFNKGIFLLRCGHFEEGWALYESRWQLNVAPFNYRPFKIPKWEGEPLENKTLLLHYEQGIGDCIQFIRYALFLKQLNYNIIVWPHPALKSFLEYNLKMYNIEILSSTNNINCDKYISLMSIPHILRTDESNIPFKDGYLFPPNEKKEIWKNRIKSSNNRIKIGLFWDSQSDFSNNHLRNISFELLENLLSLNVEFHYLQKTISEKDRNQIQKYTNFHIWENEISDFCDTSNIISQLDLVISVDTAIAHLSAAMGKTTWIMIPYSADFRWLLYREDSIWYNSVRLFRQGLDYDWKPVIQRVLQEISKLMYK